ncbi:MAG: hypothetical protein Q9195_000224 [Heterodermia aff. obscurata]
MATHMNPLDSGAIASWQNQPSNLTTALQSTSGNEVRPVQAMNITGANGKSGSLGTGHRESLGGVSGSDWKSSDGAQPISMNREKPRRESLAGSMVGGMSWGGVSVGSWVRDDIIMQGSSPFPYRSPSYHSSSYFPKLEANFMRDFRCCDLTLPTTHELLQHYEECHTQHMPESMRKPSTQSNAQLGTKAIAPSDRASESQDQTQKEEPRNDATNRLQPGSMLKPPTSPKDSQVGKSKGGMAGYESGQIAPSQDMDGLQDMEMDMDDDAMAPPENYQSQQYQIADPPRMMQRSQFGQPPSMRVPPLNIDTINMARPIQQHQGLRTSTPSTPIGPSRAGQIYQHNPTVSSVNTPTLSAHPRHQQQYVPTPDSSAPGTPGEPVIDYGGGNLLMSGQPYMQDPYQFSNFNDFSDSHDIASLYIDEPAKRLFHNNSSKKYVPKPPPGSQTSQLGDGQYSENSEVARTIREVQRSVGVPEPQTDGGVPKPFHCPVIGCEKAYKNQNGLKYHKMHGHNSQRLADNKDGTYSIVDPDTLCPYPGTLGMEKHKPFRCDVCGKRYKNLNGLKYHKSHSTACDNEPRSDSGFMLAAPMMPPGKHDLLGDEMDL